MGLVGHGLGLPRAGLAVAWAVLTMFWAGMGGLGMGWW
jgi:hypothetical protein